MASQAWINIYVNGQSKVGGPVTGNGIFKLITAGIHVYTTQAKAQAAQPQTITQEQATVIEDIALSGPGLGQGFFGLGHDVQQAANAPLTGLAAVGDLAQRLSQGSTWLRVGEFIAGGLLLYIGLNAVTRGTAASSAIQTGKGVVKKVVTK